VKALALVPLLLLGACGRGGPEIDSRPGDKTEEFALPVRVVAPARGPVEDYVETQAALDTDRKVELRAEMTGRVRRRLRDVGDVIGTAPDGQDPLLLATLEDDDRALALKETLVALEEAKGRGRELVVEARRLDRELDQATVARDEAQAAYARAEAGQKDGTISKEEFEKATFALALAKSKVGVADVGLEKAKLAVELNAIEVSKAELARDRAELDQKKAYVRAPFPGVVTYCNVQPGQWVREGDHLYSVEDLSTLIVYGDLPVRQATRVRVGNPVLLTSSAVRAVTKGEVTLVSPTVDRATGTVRVKIAVEPAPGFDPGLFVTLRIVVAKRPDALVVPKRCVLHDDEEGAYLFTVDDGRARRVLVTTGFQKDDRVEIAEGIAADAVVVIEGQDTLTDGAKVDVEEEAAGGDAESDE
jgi:membrane fusion protein (multidrug efflux system)